MTGLAAATSGAVGLLGGARPAAAAPAGNPKGFYDAEYVSRPETFDPRLFGARGDGMTDDTAAFQQAIDSAARIRGSVTVTAGNYAIDSIRLPNLVRLHGMGADVARYASGQQGGVNLFHIPFSNSPMIVVDGNGCGLERLNLLGNGSTQPLLHVANGFESRFSAIQLSGVSGTALVVDRVNNNTWNDIFVNSCGTQESPAMVVRSRGGINAQFTNAFTCTNLTIEGSPNTALDLGSGTSENDYLEFVRLYNLHVEHDTASSLSPAQMQLGLVRVGNVRHVEFIAPFLVGGPGPLLVHDDIGRYRPELMSGIRILGGSFVGAARDGSGEPSDTIVALRHGDDFAAVGSRFGRFSGAAVHVGADYGSRVSVDPSTTVPDERDGTLLTDERPASSRSTWVWPGALTVASDLEIGRHLTTSKEAVKPSAEALPANGSKAPRPRIYGNDTAGTVFFGSGADPSTGPHIRVVFTRPFSRPPTVVVSASESSSAGLTPFVRSRNDYFEIHLPESIPRTKAGADFAFSYVVVG